MSNDPAIDANSAQVLARSHDDAKAIASKLAEVPEVAEARTFESFIPSDQSRKLTLIRHAERSLGPAFDTAPEAAPTDEENIGALRNAAEALDAAAGKSSAQGARAARRLAGDLSQLANATESDRVRATNAFIIPLEMDLDSLRQSLRAKPVDMLSCSGFHCAELAMCY